ncbi:MAG: sigma-70 family RNA polymerase sigma factor [Ruminococcaceae bacterium]|nr:sigma-70 family RNA polymerase sigma factor [Oscillospiraceae bacterium]
MKDADLKMNISKVRAGDKEAFGIIYSELKKPVFTVALRIVGDVPLAEDITQDVFVKLFLLPPPPSVKNPRAWIFKMARNLSIDALRKTQSLSIYDNEPEPYDESSLIAEKIDLMRAFKKLSVSERQIVALHLNASLKFSEISDIMDLSLSAVYRRYKKALKTLRDYLEVERL